jgi:hypothetical protein
MFELLFSMKHGLAIIAWALTIISAQNVPPCVQDCITPQCSDGAVDTGCFCNPLNEILILECVAANCSTAEAAATISLQSLCGNLPPAFEN